MVKVHVSEVKFARFSPGPLLKQAFRLFDVHHNGQVTYDELESVVVGIFKGREFMARMLRDTHKIIKEVRRCIFAFLILMSVCLLFTIVGETLLGTFGR